MCVKGLARGLEAMSVCVCVGVVSYMSRIKSVSTWIDEATVILKLLQERNGGLGDSGRGPGFGGLGLKPECNTAGLGLWSDK